MADCTKADNELKMKAKKEMMNTKDPVERCKLALLARGTAGIKNMSRWFRIMDDDGNKQLNKEEFVTGMKDFGVSLNKEELELVYDAFDADDSGSINVTEFLQQMQPKMSDARMKLVREAFNKFDKSGDKKIDVADLNEIDVKDHPKYKNGEWTRKQCLNEFLKTFDSKVHDEDRTVTDTEFIAYYSAISCGIDSDAYFDLMMRQAWDL
ncbi:hypothetical protein LOTGIDRAFT_202142 [Lottia gigantea]|uniref:EF-hand domain-containing protein n=1 Tax=Lottia gigantea TaxID=225164 RepID=V4ANP7_LOTGI|nr:hypothetical protein LOTGIDRAFT_202142 [Lottia gigantea]ESO96370.1 hypothetical protein LOTGIDRAFT_202142 [Lottia gigantea]